MSLCLFSFQLTLSPSILFLRLLDRCSQGHVSLVLLYFFPFYPLTLCATADSSGRTKNQMLIRLMKIQETINMFTVLSDIQTLYFIHICTYDLRKSKSVQQVYEALLANMSIRVHTWYF